MDRSTMTKYGGWIFEDTILVGQSSTSMGAETYSNKHKYNEEKSLHDIVPLPTRPEGENSRRNLDYKVMDHLKKEVIHLSSSKRGLHLNLPNEWQVRKSSIEYNGHI
jgi:hypothetical protein